jgi:hypothetical protein
MKGGFLTIQLGYLLRSYPLRRTWRHKLFTLVEILRLFLSYSVLMFTSRFGPRPSGPRETNCAVVILSHNRPQNLSLIVRAALRNRFVSKLIVSNSNPEVQIRDWVNVTDGRLTLIDEKRPTQPGHRIVLARDTGADYCLAIDDDIFLTPSQWAECFRRLLEDPEVPHGITGNLYKPGIRSSNGSPFHHITGVEATVDVLIGAYAFTREHALRVFDLAKAIGVDNLSLVRNYDDILLSFAGNARPRIHAIKPALLCASASLPGIALWKSDEQFWSERERVFGQVQAARSALDGAWDY